MKFLLTPKSDFVFKIMFTADTETLADLITSALKLPEDRRIRSVTVKNPILPGEKEIRQKYIVLDILATDEAGNHYDIEMQVRRYSFYPKRMLFYLSRVYTGQLERGKDYGLLSPVIGIHFLDYELFPDHKEFRYCFDLRDARYPKLKLTDDMCLYIFELPKFEKKIKKMKTRRLRDSLSEWLYFFNHADEEGDETMRTHYRNPSVHKAFGVLEALSADEETRRLAEIREQSMINEMYELAAARKEGEKTGEKRGEKRGKKKRDDEIALKMLNDGMDPEVIMKYTGLSTGEIGGLKKQS